jgi:hypothetical protein
MRPVYLSAGLSGALLAGLIGGAQFYGVLTTATMTARFEVKHRHPGSSRALYLRDKALAKK